MWLAHTDCTVVQYFAFLTSLSIGFCATAARFCTDTHCNPLLVPTVALFSTLKVCTTNRYNCVETWRHKQLSNTILYQKICGIPEKWDVKNRSKHIEYDSVLCLVLSPWKLIERLADTFPPQLTRCTSSAAFWVLTKSAKKWHFDANSLTHHPTKTCFTFQKELILS